MYKWVPILSTRYTTYLPLLDCVGTPRCNLNGDLSTPPRRIGGLSGTWGLGGWRKNMLLPYDILEVWTLTFFFLPPNSKSACGAVDGSDRNCDNVYTKWDR